mgnify:CR=1 FL=1|tara:strand:- start:291 stop:485 length:195 start_codon:yes stop_codon:yes gene_type:complete
MKTEKINKLKNFLNNITSTFSRKRKVKKAINESIEKNKKVLEKLGDEVDYDGMGDWGRFPPIKK